VAECADFGDGGGDDYEHDFHEYDLDDYDVDEYDEDEFGDEDDGEELPDASDANALTVRDQYYRESVEA